MIYTVTLNAAIDEIIELEYFNKNAVSNVLDITKKAGGKGINVSRGLNILGTDSQAIALIGNKSKDFFENELKNEGLNFKPFYYEGETRTSQTLVFQQDCINTHIKKKIMLSDGNYFDLIKDYLLKVVKKGDILVLSGSIPQGVNEEIYAEIIEVMRDKNVLTFLDSSGEALEYGISAVPFCLKVNLNEFIDFAEQPENEVQDFKKSAENLIKSGISLIIITMGSEGAVLYNGEDYYFAKVKEDNNANQQWYSVGSGDSFMAGFLSSFIEEKDVLDCFKNGIACGRANTIIKGSGFFEKKDVESFINKIEIKTEF